MLKNVYEALKANKDAMLAAEQGEVGVDMFNLGFRCVWRLNYLVFCPIKHVNTFVFCLENIGKRGRTRMPLT